jgi:L-glyceraldehyde 3-phosphate reductase
MARARGQNLAQMALAWVLRHTEVTSAVIGTSKVGQIDDSVKALEHADFTAEELERIDSILAGK